MTLKEDFLKINNLSEKTLKAILATNIVLETMN